MELVSALKNALPCVGGPHAQLLDLAEHSHSVLGDGMANSRDDGVVSERLSVVENIHATL